MVAERGQTCMMCCRVLRRLVGHTREVSGIAVAPCGETAVSCAADCTVKIWRVPDAPLEHGAVQEDATAQAELVGQHAFLGIDYHYQRECFATCGHAVDLWDAERSEPVQTFTWGSESVTSVRFNPVRLGDSYCECAAARSACAVAGARQCLC